MADESVVQGTVSEALLGRTTSALQGLCEFTARKDSEVGTKAKRPANCPGKIEGPKTRDMTSERLPPKAVGIIGDFENAGATRRYVPRYMQPKSSSASSHGSSRRGSLKKCGACLSLRISNVLVGATLPREASSNKSSSYPQLNWLPGTRFAALPACPTTTTLRVILRPLFVCSRCSIPG